MYRLYSKKEFFLVNIVVKKIKVKVIVCFLAHAKKFVRRG